MPRSSTVLDTYIGAQIATRRAALGLSQTALAETIGVSFQQVQKYESGTNRISASRLHGIAQTLAVPIPDLFPLAPIPQASGAGTDPDSGPEVRLMLGLPEGRAVLAAFPRIADAPLRRALARIVERLADAR